MAIFCEYFFFFNFNSSRKVLSMSIFRAYNQELGYRMHTVGFIIRTRRIHIVFVCSICVNVCVALTLYCCFLSLGSLTPKYYSNTHTLTYICHEILESNHKTRTALSKKIQDSFHVFTLICVLLVIVQNRVAHYSTVLLISSQPRLDSTQWTCIGFLLSRNGKERCI